MIPPDEERSPGKGNPFPQSLSRLPHRLPSSRRYGRPGANPSPIPRERFGVSFRFTVHAAEADQKQAGVPPPAPPLGNAVGLFFFLLRVQRAGVSYMPPDTHGLVQHFYAGFLMIRDRFPLDSFSFFCSLPNLVCIVNQL